MAHQRQDFFNRCARSWDNAEGYSPEKIQTMLLLSDIAPHSVVLDVGCGTGILEPYLLAYNPAAILAVDLAKNMIDEAKRKITHPGVKFVCADIMDISGLEADNCFIFNTLGHLDDPKTTLEHIAGLMRPSGRITISHIQGLKLAPNENRDSPPAQYLQKLLDPLFHVDVAIDNNAMLMVSAAKK